MSFSAGLIRSPVLPAVVFAVLQCAVLGDSLLAGDARLPVPDQAKQDEMRKLVRDLFKADYAKTSPRDCVILAAKLVQHANESKDDPGSRFVLLREARDLSAQGGDLRTILQTLDLIVKDFAVDGGQEWLMVLPKMEAAAKTAEQAGKLTESLLQAADGSVAMDDYDAAENLILRAEAVAARAQSIPLLAKAKARKKEIQELAQQGKAIDAARQTLKATPDDPEANLTVGKFTCFVKGDWAKGLPLLVKGSDASLKALAEKEAAAPQEGGQQLALADGWWALAEKATGAQRQSLQTRAIKWYQDALPNLSGIQKMKAEQRLALRKTPKEPTAGAASTRSYAGTWTRQDTGSVFVLAEDGTFKKTLGAGQPNQEEHGRWVIAENGITWIKDGGQPVQLTAEDQTTLRGPSPEGFIFVLTRKREAQRIADKASLVGIWVKQDTGTEFLFAKDGTVSKLQNGTPISPGAHFGRGMWSVEGKRLSMNFQNGGAVVVSIIDSRQLEPISTETGGGRWTLWKK